MKVIAKTNTGVFDVQLLSVPLRVCTLFLRLRAVHAPWNLHAARVKITELAADCHADDISNVPNSL